MDAVTPTTALRVLVVDDDPLVRTGLRIMLTGDPAITAVVEAADGDEVADAVAAERPDVVLMDVRMARLDGVEAVRRLVASRHDAPPVIMITTFDAEPTVLAAVQAGAAGFLVKHAPPEEIVAAIHAAAAGDPVFSPSVLRTVVGRLRDSGVPAPTSPMTVELTDRERAVAGGVARGLSNADIAAELYVSAGTVKAEISTLLTKSGLDNRIQLAVWTVRHLDPD